MAANANPQLKKNAFLAAYSKCGSIAAASRFAKIDRGCHYTWMAKDPEYAHAFEAADKQAADNLEGEAFKRAHAGSDLLLIFLLKGAKPWKYRENSRIEHTGKDGAPLELNVSASELLLSRIASIASRAGQKTGD